MLRMSGSFTLKILPMKMMRKMKISFHESVVMLLRCFRSYVVYYLMFIFVIICIISPYAFHLLTLIEGSNRRQ